MHGFHPPPCPMNPIAKSPLPAAPAQAPATSTGQAASKDKGHDGSFEDLMPGAKNQQPGKNIQPSPGKDSNRPPAKSAPDKTMVQSPKPGAKASTKNPSAPPDPAKDANSEEAVTRAKTPLENAPAPIPSANLTAPYPTPVQTQVSGDLGFDLGSDSNAGSTDVSSATSEPSPLSSGLAWTSVRMSQAPLDTGISPQMPVQAPVQSIPVALSQTPARPTPAAASDPSTAPAAAIASEPATGPAPEPDFATVPTGADFSTTDNFSTSNVRWLTAAPAATTAPTDPDVATIPAAPAVSTVSMVTLQSTAPGLPVDLTLSTQPSAPNLSTETSGTGIKAPPTETELAASKSATDSAPEVKEKLAPSNSTQSQAAQSFSLQAKAGGQTGSRESSDAAVQIRANATANKEPGTATAMHPPAMSDPADPRQSLPKTAGFADAAMADLHISSSVAPQAQSQDPQQKPGDKKSNAQTASAGEIAEPALNAPQFTGAMAGSMAGSQKSAPIPATEITTVVHRTLEAAEHVRMSGQERVEIRMRLDSGQELLIELRVSQQGEVKPVFRTESEALRQALEQNWSRFSSAGTERGIKLSNPVFESPQTQSGMSDLNQNHDGRERAFAQARDESFTSTLLRGVGAKTPAPTKPQLVSGAESASRYA